MEKMSEILAKQMLTPEGLRQWSERESSYARGVTHGIELAFRILDGSETPEDFRLKLCKANDIALNFRNTKNYPPAFTDAVLKKMRE